MVTLGNYQHFFQLGRDNQITIVWPHIIKDQ